MCISFCRNSGGNFTTIPQFFKQHGYKTVGMGKIFHHGIASNNDDAPSWTVPYWRPSNRAYWDNKLFSWMAVDSQSRREKPLPDEQTLQRAIKVSNCHM